MMIVLAVFALTVIAQAETDHPYAKPDDTWISIDGEVISTSPDAFVLDYGDGMITVEMDDWDDDADGYKLLKGDKVNVTGVVDADLFEATSIEASSVYVEGLNTYFYASATDEEDANFYIGLATPVTVSEASLQGFVTEVNGDEFTLNSGFLKLTVDTDAMPYDPLDNKGYQKIEEGDKVQVSGTLVNDFFTEKELIADGVVTLAQSGN
jgi:uncharacterized protein YdeI (BOF family)